MDVILSSDVLPNTLPIREQIIGEARAFKICAEYPEAHHKKLVKLKERKQDDKLDEYPLL